MQCYDLMPGGGLWMVTVHGGGDSLFTVTTVQAMAHRQWPMMRPATVYDRNKSGH
ncbi:integrase [Sesbania bispinosa]|nr:integrase [Sesbania bispinosa]